MTQVQPSPNDVASAAVSPLQGVRVLSFGGIWAGRLASMLLADQGAEVIEINRPAEEVPLARALLSRGKREIELDLGTTEGRATARQLAATADIVIDNLGTGRSARYGIDYERLRQSNKGLIYISIPAAASGTTEPVGGWEASISGSVGVFTDIHALGPSLGGKPVFSSLPMASAYGGVHAAIAASAALLNRLSTGEGAFVEVPLRDAVLSAMALLIMKIEDQPRYFDLPPIEKSMTEVALPILRDLHAQLTNEHRSAVRAYFSRESQPFFANHRCKDGRFIFINAMGHVHQARACLETIGVLDELIAEGMIVASPYQIGPGNNIADAAGLTAAWKQRIWSLMSQRLQTKAASQWEELLQNAAVPVSVVRTAEEWLNLPMARVGENVAVLHDPKFAETRQAGRFVSISGEKQKSPELRARVASDGHWSQPRAEPKGNPSRKGRKVLEGLKVIDLSNVIAGPLSGRVLAELGADVIRVDPVNPHAGPRMTIWFGLDVNQGKRALILDLKSENGRQVLSRLVRDADVLLHNYLDRSLAGIGISDEQLREINPDIVICQISAWGGPTGGPFKDFPAYDPVLQAATGITARYGSPATPVMHGVASCVDYITGFSAALGVLQALIGRELGRGSASVRTSLAMGSQLVQFPFVIQSAEGRTTEAPAGQDVAGYGPHYRMYRARDGWATLCCRAGDLIRVADALRSKDTTEAALEEAIADLTIGEMNRRLASIRAASITPITRLDDLRDRIVVPEESQGDLTLDGRSLLMVDRNHPSDHRISLPFPSWYRSNTISARPLSPSPRAGSNTVSVLKEIGYSTDEIRELLEQKVAAKAWPISPNYFPTVGQAS